MISISKEQYNALKFDADRYKWLESRDGLVLRSEKQPSVWTRLDGSKYSASHYLAEGGMQHTTAESLSETIDLAMQCKNTECGKDDSVRTIDDGGLAFPTENERQTGANSYHYSSMTLRDYFIASITPPEDISIDYGEIMVRPYPTDEHGKRLAFSKETILWRADVEAAWRVAQADAMIKARNTR